MNKHQSGLAWHHHLKNAVLFLAGILLMTEGAELQLGHISKSLGEAILIAVLVIYFVELQSHQRLEETAVQMIKKVGRNIFGLVYGHELPEPFSGSLERILKQPIYRDHMKLDAHLKSVKLKGVDDSEHKLCQLKCTFSYDLVNCSDVPVTQPIQVFLERDKWLAELVSDDQTDPVLEYLKIGNELYVKPDREQEVRARLSAFEIPSHSLDELISEGDNGNELVFRKDGVTIPAGDRISVKFSGLLYKRYSDNEIWSTFYPTKSLELSVNSTEFEVEARFPSAGKDLSSDLEDDSSKWFYNAPLLTGQFVLYWWRPKKAGVS